MCMYVKVYLLANFRNSVKARRSAESAVFLRDMLEYKMEYDDVLTSKDSSSTKVLQHRPDYSMHHFDLSAEGTDTRQHAHTQGVSPGAETPFPDGWRGGGMRGSSVSTSSSARRNTSMAASQSSIVVPRKYHFESPPVSRRNTGIRTHTRMCTDTQPQPHS